MINFVQISFYIFLYMFFLQSQKLSQLKLLFENVHNAKYILFVLLFSEIKIQFKKKIEQT